MPASIPLDWLHLVIQRAMGWGNHHLHDFFIDGIHYGDSSIDNVLGFEEETKYALSDLMKEPGAKFVYEYDFGDDWEHELILEKILRMDADLRYPVCVKGANACPPEDCGGIWSYYQKLKALKDPSDPQSAEIREWFGYDFDPAEFSLKAINRDLGELAPPHRPKKRMRR